MRSSAEIDEFLLQYECFPYKSNELTSKEGMFHLSYNSTPKW